MARRKEFKGLAKNLAQWCLSRNNDYLGYWSIGQLYKFAQKNKTNFVSVDILNAKFSLESESLPIHYGSLVEIIRHQMVTLSIPESWLKSVVVNFQFEAPYQHKYHVWGMAIGNPMICSVLIVTDRGREYYGESGCNCWVHSQIKESRRNGF